MAGEAGERETFVSIPRSIWFRWEQWCEFNGFEPRHKFVSVLRLWMSDVTDAELDAHLASTKKKGAAAMAGEGRFPCVICGMADETVELTHVVEWDMSLPFCGNCREQAEESARLWDAIARNFEKTVRIATGRW